MDDLDCKLKAIADSYCVDHAVSLDDGGEVRRTCLHSFALEVAILVLHIETAELLKEG